MRVGFRERYEIREDKGERSLPASDSFTFPKELKAKPMFAKELHIHGGLDSEPETDGFEFPKELSPRF